MTDEVYCYAPDSSVLRNKLDIRDAAELARAERQLVLDRVRQGIPSGDFDLGHLRAIHRHLFQDVYAWAGEVRTVEIAKDGHQFQFRRFIETGMADVHARLVDRNQLRGLTREAFADAAAEIIGDVNYVHPFREGNGRVQALYLQQLAAKLGTTSPSLGSSGTRGCRRLGGRMPATTHCSRKLFGRLWRLDEAIVPVAPFAPGADIVLDPWIAQGRQREEGAG